MVFAGVLALTGCATRPLPVTPAPSTRALDDPASHAIIRLWPTDAPATQPYNKPEAGETFIAEGGDAHLFGVKGVTRPWMVQFLPATPAEDRTAVILCPGGGYSYESLVHEGVQVARRLNTNGIAAFVLKYRLPDGSTPAADALPAPQQDVLRAVQLVRANASEWGIDPHRVGVMGFSAGGHLAATAATLYGEAGKLDAIVTDAGSVQSARPDFVALLYPVISMDPALRKSGTRTNLLGKDPSAGAVQHLSADRNVTSQTPPLFICAAQDDSRIPYHHSELMALAAERANVPFKFMLLEHGEHGFGLGSSNPKKLETKLWYPQFLQWLADGGFLMQER